MFRSSIAQSLFVASCLMMACAEGSGETGGGGATSTGDAGGPSSSNTGGNGGAPTTSTTSTGGAPTTSTVTTGGNGGTSTTNTTNATNNVVNANSAPASNNSSSTGPMMCDMITCALVCISMMDLPGCTINDCMCDQLINSASSGLPSGVGGGSGIGGFFPSGVGGGLPFP
jgi:hypothetical protein